MADVKFYPEEHKYTVDGVEVISVTQLLKKHGIIKFGDYTNETIEKAKNEGTFFHKEAELVVKGELKPEDMLSKEASQFLIWLNALPSKPVYAEKICYYGLIFAGTADMIYRDKDGKWVLVDYKTGMYHPKEHRWQLNLYRKAFATIGIFIDRMQVWCFKDSKIYEVEAMPDAELDELLAAEQAGHILGESKTLALTRKGDKEVLNVKAELMKIKRAVQQADAVKKKYDKCRKELLDYMRSHGGITKITSPVVNFTLVTKKDSDAFDKEQFEKDYPDLAKEYSYKKPNSPYVKVDWVDKKKEKKEKKEKKA